MKWSQKVMPEADILSPLKNMLIPKLAKIASKDTKRSSFAEDAGTSYLEYLDNSWEFFSYLRSMFYANRLNRDENRPKIPVIKEL